MKQGLFLIAAVAMAGPPAMAKDVTLQKVKYAQLTQQVQQLKGKVVVVDFWSIYCIPCMKKIPGMVALHERYHDHGLEVISVSLDKAELEPKVKAFLEKQKATFINLLLDEGPDVWQNKLRIKEVPCYFVFDRQGKIHTRYNDAPRMDAFAKELVELLREKP